MWKKSTLPPCSLLPPKNGRQTCLPGVVVRPCACTTAASAPAATSWRAIGQAFADGLDRALAAERDAVPSGNWVTTLELRQEFRRARDEFTFTRPYQFPDLGGVVHGYRIVTLIGRFQAADDLLSYDLMSARLRDLDGAVTPFSPEDRERIQATITNGLRSVLAQPLTDAPIPPASLRCTPGAAGDARCLRLVGPLLALAAGLPDADQVAPHNLQCMAVANAPNDGGECHFVPNVKRVNHRVDGVEVVLSETDPVTGRDADPFYQLLEDAGACHGFEPGAEPRACLHASVFEITPPSMIGIDVCGDELLLPR